MHNNKTNPKSFIPPAVGFTLVEVVIAMLLLLMALTAFVVSFVQSRRSALLAENRLEAIHQARDKMETICSYLYSSTGLSVVPNPNTFYFPGGFYTVSNNPVANTKDVVVTIKWVSPPGRTTSSVALASAISQELHQ